MPNNQLFLDIVGKATSKIDFLKKIENQIENLKDILVRINELNDMRYREEMEKLSIELKKLLPETNSLTHTPLSLFNSIFFDIINKINQAATSESYYGNTLSLAAKIKIQDLKSYIGDIKNEIVDIDINKKIGSFLKNSLLLSKINLHLKTQKNYADSLKTKKILQKHLPDFNTWYIAYVIMPFLVEHISNAFKTIKQALEKNDLFYVKSKNNHFNFTAPRPSPKRLKIYHDESSTVEFSLHQARP
jgi:hypothetical protein